MDLEVDQGGGSSLRRWWIRCWSRSSGGGAGAGQSREQVVEPGIEVSRCRDIKEVVWRRYWRGGAGGELRWSADRISAVELTDQVSTGAGGGVGTGGGVGGGVGIWHWRWSRWWSWRDQVLKQQQWWSWTWIRVLEQEQVVCRYWRWSRG
ncbi:hypothetical protein CEXT_766351 [Caerostris extrusa]|uniref:Uncharacterized protein n=1 Tax=Caerostris extrusa TaxID=172846 RepID=A0AAV4UDC1_CAEEX|nr:hypothetical protein CEXT_766351 [Caerostris extrusa]